jgi:hypothetical protein
VEQEAGSQAGAASELGPGGPRRRDGLATVSAVTAASAGSAARLGRQLARQLARDRRGHSRNT